MLRRLPFVAIISALSFSLLTVASAATRHKAHYAVAHTVPQPTYALGVGPIPVFQSAAIAREWADAAVLAGHFDAASQAYFQESDLRTKIGDTQASEVERRRAWATMTDIKIACPASYLPGSEAYPLAKLEPQAGCLIGSLDTPTEGKTFDGESVADNFAQRIGKPVAVAFRYLRYGQEFPFAWAHLQAEHGRAIELAVEPYDIFAVNDDEYLEGFAADMKQSGAKVFLRFGGEMNGQWAPWGKNPEQYRKAFRTVHDVIAQFCPNNCAMVWAPDMAPLNNIDQYYPGDDVVDWVGLSLYLVKYSDDNKTEPSWQNSPMVYIDPFYQKYAQRKPMAIVECGVSRFAHCEGITSDDYAAARIEDLLSAIKIRYANLKMFCWFDRNNLNGNDMDRRLNDFSLPPDSGALMAFKNCIADPYFLSQMPDDTHQLTHYVSLDSALAQGYSGPASISLCTYCLNPTITITRNSVSQTYSRPFNLNIPSGTGPVIITVADQAGHLAKSIVAGGLTSSNLASNH